MSPKQNTPSSSHRTQSKPYASATQRRSSGQPKSSRQQFSACGACRLRRVRCDLKDLQAVSPNASSCSNCHIRRVRCVDEFAEVKAVKLLRRGRRLQQVEAVYGKVSPEDDRQSPPAPCSVIPKLRPEFFSSPFFRRLHVQRPILEPSDFTSRFFASLKGDPSALGVAGQLICMCLVTWAASFGLNEYGDEEPHGSMSTIRRRIDRTNEMVREILHLIDINGLLRKPTWDGVRALLFILPLTELVQTPMERLSIYEIAMTQTYTLCSIASVSSVNSGHGDYVDGLVRMLIFDYAFIHEGITTGLRGGRLLLSDDDLPDFQATLPQLSGNSSLTQAAMNYSFAHRFAKAPLRLSCTCRQVHMALTGPRARRRDEIDEERLRDAWGSLELLWEEFESLRHLGTAGFMQPDDVELYIAGWQIAVFECQNIIREALKQRLVAFSNGDGAYRSDEDIAHDPRVTQLIRLHALADSKCHDIVQHVVAIVRRHQGGLLFQFDASVVRDGIFFAGLLAGEAGTEDDVKVCLHALREMRWAFSKSEEREHTLRMLWESRLAADAQRHADAELRRSDPPQQDSGASPYSTPPSRVRHPPQLALIHTNVIIDSGPSTATTEDGPAWTTMSTPSSSAHSHAAECMDSRHSSSCSSSAGSPPYIAPANLLSHSNLTHLNGKIESLGSALMLNTGVPPLVGDMNSPRSASFYPVHDVEQFSFVEVGGDAVHRTHPTVTVSIPSPPSQYQNEHYFDATAVVFPPPPGSATPTSDTSATMHSDETTFAQFPHNHFYVNQ